MPGDLIGRMARAALRIEDPRISEAHALVSLRGTELRLLALRGRLGVDGRPVSSARLFPGQRVVLSGFFALRVEQVLLPERVFALDIEGEGDEGLGPLAIEGVLAIHPGPPLRVVPQFDPGAPLIVWVDDLGVRVHPREGSPRRLGDGDALTLGGLTLSASMLPLATLDSPSTAEAGLYDVPLTVAIHYDTVQVRPATGAPVVFDGLLARLISELAELDTPIGWRGIAELLWEDEPDEHVLRYRWDQATSRIRKRLRAAGLRSDLIRSNAGLVQLFLGPEDRVEDLA